MNLIKSFFLAFFFQNYAFFLHQPRQYVIYIILFLILFLENGIIIASFLPGDSLLIFVGILASKRIINYFFVIPILTISVCLGYWFSYTQGKWLSKGKLLKNMFIFFSLKHRNKAYKIFNRYGLSSFFFGRFLAFIRTLLPFIAGLSDLLNYKRFHFFNWISGFFWVFILVTVGFFFGKSLFFQLYEKYIINILIFVPILLLIIALVRFLYRFLKKKFFFKF